MKITITLHRDSANSYPGEIEIYEGMETLLFELKNPEREFSISKDDFVKLNKIIQVA